MIFYDKDPHITGNEQYLIRNSALIRPCRGKRIGSAFKDYEVDLWKEELISSQRSCRSTVKNRFKLIT